MQPQAMNRAWWQLPEQEEENPSIPDMEMMDPTQPPALPNLRTPLSRLGPPQMESPDVPPNMGGASGPPSMDAASPAPSMPDMDPAAMGRNPAYRAAMVNERMRQDESAPPSGLRNQGYETDKEIAMGHRLQEMKPKPWQQILGGVLSAFPTTRGIDVNPALTRQRKNLALQGQLAEAERKSQIAQGNEESRRDAAETNRVYRESTAESQRQAAEDRRLKFLTDPNLEELPAGAGEPGPNYRGAMDVSGKRYGVLKPEVLAGRKAQAQKAAEQETWLDVPLPLQQKYGLGPKAPHQTIDGAIRLVEAEGRAQEAAALRRELASQTDSTRRYIADQSNATRAAVARPEDRKRGESAALDKVLRAAGGDYQKAISLGYDKVTELAGEHAAKVWEGLTKQSQTQTKIDEGTAQEKQRRDSANTTVEAAKRAIQLIDEVQKTHPNYTGAGIGKRIVSGVRSATSTEPDIFGAADTALESAAALQPGQHGFRSQGALDNFKRALGIDPKTGKATGSREWLRNPEKTKAALREIARFNETLMRNLGKGRQQDAQPPQADPLGIF